MTASDDCLIATATELEKLSGAPMPGAIEKVFPRLDRYSRQFIELSPFACLGSCNQRDGLDVSPRGDGPGFVKVLDDCRLLFPERPGNRRHDTMKNLLEHPAIGILFFVPGIPETLRVNGQARLTQDAKLLSACEYRGHTPPFGILVDIEEVFFHCGKALIRSGLWSHNPAVGRPAFPMMGEVVREQTKLHESPEKIEEAVQESYIRDLY